MKYTDAQISAIKIFGKKDLTEGCIVSIVFDSEPDVHKEIVRLRTDEQIRKAKEYFSEGNPGILYKEILGHEPNLEDVFRVADQKEKGFLLNDESLFIFGIEIQYNPYIPLLEQSEETLTQLINLFK